MCLTCGKHVSERLWYLEPEKHRVRSMGLLRDVVNRNIHPIVVSGLKLVRKKQPYGADDRLTGISKSLLDWFAKTIHGVQVLPDMDSTFEVIDRANELALIPCICQQVMAPHLAPTWRCIGLNIAARVYFRRELKEPVRAIGKQEAKEIVAEWRQRGAMQSAGWLWDAQVIWVCNCDEHCVSHRVPELEWGMVPSFVASKLIRPEACGGCQECANWCARPGALTFGEDGRAVIDEALCRGCGLCIEHCPNGALGYVSRRVFYDVLTKTVRPLSGAIYYPHLE
jgi:Pyruvate/2-oxoacid:ferredoxin oxidoreductase delta subunit